MIPKIIHYCWFGRSDKPILAQKCISSWKKYCPDYQLIEWNEDNFDLTASPFTKFCLNEKKYAFCSDFARLRILKEYGGIYMDTDVELIRPLDDLLGCEAYYGFEDSQHINTGLGFGTEANHPVVSSMLEEYLKIGCNNSEGGISLNADIISFPLLACPQLNTEALVKLGLKLDGKHQSIAGAEIFPVDYFNPFDDATGRIMKTKNTFSIHWYAKSWISKKTVIRSHIMRPIHRIFGVDCMKFLKRNC